MKFFKKNNTPTIKIMCMNMLFSLCSFTLVYAAAPDTSNLDKKTFQQLIADLILIASQYVLTILVALTIFVFLYGLTKYMFKGQGSDTARSEGRKLMLWGVIGIFVMTSVWGLVAIFASFVGHTDIVIPQF